MKESLYRKYRPSRFDEVVGQNIIVSILKNAIQKNTIGHSYLFVGQKGIGKTSIARILAKSLNCKNSSNGEACNKCVSCQSYNLRKNMDIIELDAASHNSVDDIREIQDKMNYHATEGEYKIYVIDEAHMLSKSAFNAFLKTLEETPENIVFILATTEIYKIPETIISRCQVLNFQPFFRHEIKDQLLKICNLEKIKFENKALELIAFFSEGSMRDAISHLEKVISFSNDVTVKNINKVYYLSSNEEILQLLIAYQENDYKLLLKILDSLIFKNINIKILSGIIAQVVIDFIIYKNIGSEKHLTFFSKEEFSKLNLEIKKAKKLIEKLMKLISKKIDGNYLAINFELIFLSGVDDILNKEDIKEIQKELKEELKEEIQKETTMEVHINKDEEDVAKEEKVEKKKIDKTFSNDDLINIIAQKDENIIENLKLNWKKIQDYFNDKRYAKFVSPLLSAQIMFACKGGMALYYEYSIESETINEWRLNKRFIDFLEEVFGEKYLVFALNKESLDNFKVFFDNYKKTKAKPIPKEIKIIEMEDDPEITKEIERKQIEELEAMFED